MTTTFTLTHVHRTSRRTPPRHFATREEAQAAAQLEAGPMMLTFVLINADVECADAAHLGSYCIRSISHF